MSAAKRTVNLPADLDAKAEAACKAKGKNRSQLYQAALHSYLTEAPPEKKPDPPKPAPLPEPEPLPAAVTPEHGAELPRSDMHHGASVSPQASLEPAISEKIAEKPKEEPAPEKKKKRSFLAWLADDPSKRKSA